MYCGSLLMRRPRIKPTVYLEVPDLGVTSHAGRRRESRPAVRKLIDMNFFLSSFASFAYLFFTPLFLTNTHTHTNVPFSSFFLASRLLLYTYVYIIRSEDQRARSGYRPRRSNLDYQRRAATTATTNSGKPSPRRETRHNGRNKWRSFIPAVVIIKW